MSTSARAVARKAKQKTPYVYTQAKPVKKGDPRYWTTRARATRKLFPSDILAVPRGECCDFFFFFHRVSRRRAALTDV